MRFLRRLLRGESGATAVEYAVVVGLIALGVITSVSNMTAATADSFDTSGDQLEGVLGP
ncbi:MAG: Flp family type IVb pilin [Planctomycetota bacterium]